MREREERGEKVVGPSKRELGFWRAYLWGRDRLTNVGVAVYNWVLRPLTLFKISKLGYAETELPLNLPEMIDLLFQVGHGGKGQGR
jgi:hypothetical protein